MVDPDPLSQIMFHFYPVPDSVPELESDPDPDALVRGTVPKCHGSERCSKEIKILVLSSLPYGTGFIVITL